MILTSGEWQGLGNFLNDHEGTDLATNAVGAWDYYSGYSHDLDSYAVIRVGKYYAITRIIDEWNPIEVSDEVQPFDENRIYPLQKVQKKIEWVY